jgi:hypothetical protein
METIEIHKQMYTNRNNTNKCKLEQDYRKGDNSKSQTDVH